MHVQWEWYHTPSGPLVAWTCECGLKYVRSPDVETFVCSQCRMMYTIQVLVFGNQGLPYQEPVPIGEGR